MRLHQGETRLVVGPRGARNAAAALLVLVALGFSQPYRCDWNVVGAGGGEMSGTAYRCGATAGQTATGQISGTSYAALIGFWQPEGATGVREQAYSPSAGPLVTRLYVPQPNPARTRVAIRYSLSAENRVHLTLHDLTGRVVRTLCASSMKHGAYTVTWDASGLASGLYLYRLCAGTYSASHRMIVLR